METSDLSAGIGDRIMEVRGSLSQSAFAESLNLSRSSLYRYERGERLPDSEVIARICELCNVDYTWMVTGKGSAHESDRLVGVRQYDIAASAGYGAFLDDDPEAEIVMVDRAWLAREFGVHPDHVSIINVAGDSMEPTLNHGDKVMVNTLLDQVRDGLYVLRYNGLLQVKRLQYYPRGMLRVISDNRNYEPYSVNLEEVDLTFDLVGKVIWTLKPNNS